jgi:heat shock protein HslJ
MDGSLPFLRRVRCGRRLGGAQIAGTLLLALVCASCSGDDDGGAVSPSTTAATLEGVWVLTSTDPSTVMNDISTAIRVEFSADGTFRAYDQCNTISSEWSRPESNRVTFTDERLTQMACDDRPDVLPWPLGSAQLDGRGNLLIGAGGDVVFEFAKE